MWKPISPHLDCRVREGEGVPAKLQQQHKIAAHNQRMKPIPTYPFGALAVSLFHMAYYRANKQARFSF